MDSRWIIDGWVGEHVDICRKKREEKKGADER